MQHVGDRAICALSVEFHVQRLGAYKVLALALAEISSHWDDGEYALVYPPS